MGEGSTISDTFQNAMIGFKEQIAFQQVCSISLFPENCLAAKWHEGQCWAVNHLTMPVPLVSTHHAYLISVSPSQHMHLKQGIG